MMKTIALKHEYYYHVYNRGNNSEQLFKEAADYDHFLSLLKRHLTSTMEIFAYCLLRNHFHLMIRIKKGEIARTPAQSFSNLFNSYAKYFNSKYKRTGKLFENRFKRKPIDDDSYFSEIVYYIHSNPQKHKFFGDFRHYPHSSYAALLSDKPTLLMRDEVWEWFGGKDYFAEQHNKLQTLI